ncbi:MAG: hypothetical protein DWI48_00695 [Chloroflexi bacterium]|nr:MAG: hypothetical protein DWI48_00695 [Chloroflexota bacterium]
MTNPQGETQPERLLQRRGIEAEVLIPFIRHLELELGVERAHTLARETIEAIAREQGADVAQALRREDLEGFTQVRDSWGGAGGDLTIEDVRTDATHLDFNVTQCRFAEMYQRLGARDLGSVLSCVRDFSLSEGYSPNLKLERTQTIMQGAAYCDFRYTYVPVEETTMVGSGDGVHEDAPNPQPTFGEPEEPQNLTPLPPNIRRGTGGAWFAGEDLNQRAREGFVGGIHRVEGIAEDAVERVQRAADAAGPRIQHVAQEAADYAREHQDELKGAALRAARIAARLTVPKNVRDAFEAELHRDDPKPEDAKSEPPKQ